MYRGLTANQQVGDRYGRSTTGIAPSLVSNNNATSNGEYGGWFGYGGGVSHPANSRATSETIWRTGNGGTAGPTASIQDIMQLLKQGQTLAKPVMTNVWTDRSGTNGLRLVGGGPRANAPVQQGPHPAFSGTTNQVAAAASVAPGQASQGNHAEERHQHTGEHLGPANHLQIPGGDAFQTRRSVGGSGGPTELTGAADHTSPSKANGVQQQQRSFNGHSPAAYQRLAGSIQADQMRIMKSATTLGFASERTDAPDVQQNNRHFKGPDSNAPNNRNIFNAGPVPNWRNQWSQGRPQYRLGRPTARQGPMTTNEVTGRQEPPVYLNPPGDGGSNAQGTGQFSTDTGRSVPWQTTGNGDDVGGNAVLANRLREDRTQFHPERVHSKLETVTPVEFMSPAKQKPVLSASISDENASKFGRYGLGLGTASFDKNNQSYPSKLVHEGFRSDGSSGMVPSNGSMFSQLDHENKVANGSKISDESFARSPGYPSSSSSVPSPRLGANGTQQGPLSTPRLGTNRAAQGPSFNASPKRSILKKPKIQSNDYESGISAAKRRMELYPLRHSAGSVGCFNGLSYAGHSSAVASGVDAFQSRRPDSNQKRVTFKLDQ